MEDSFRITLDVTIRPCQPGDLPALEWFGLYTRYRRLFQEQYARHERGENVFLVAIANGFPIGRLWIDLEKQRVSLTGILWAFAVLDPLQSLGIGTRLIEYAEDLLRERGFRTSELGVEKDNLRAKRLYERLGYQVVRSNFEEWDIQSPEGNLIHEFSDEWIMRKSLVEG